MAKARVKVAGLKNLQKKLATLPAESRDAAADAVEESAEATKDAMRRNVPVDTGRLRDSINARVSRKSLSAEVGTQNSRVKYAAFVEFGTSSQSEQPFAVPTAEDERTNFPDRLRKHLGEKW